jgi:mannose-6-phosphate isomerase
MALAPVILPSNQFDHFYRGGNRIGVLRNGPGGPMRPEEWIAATTTRFGEREMGLSRLPDGEFLRDAIEADPEKWLGKMHVDAFGTSIEILVKLLDPDQRLPVHFHPNKSFARKHLALDHGKTEAWIILDAPENAKVGLGFAEKMKKDAINSMVQAKDSAALLASLNMISVKPGDAVLVPAGTAHAIDAGIFVLELQEPTDLSALLEWEGFAVDGLKDGHLGLGFDLVLDSLNYEPLNPDEIGTLIKSSHFTGGEIRSLFTQRADGYFRADVIPGNGERIEAGFGILLLLEGDGVLTTENSGAIAVGHGDALVIPFDAGPWKLTGASGILSRPPLPALAKSAP